MTSWSYLLEERAIIDLMKNDGINNLFRRSTKPYQSIPRAIKSCEGIVAAMDNSFISSTCSRLYPTDKYIDIYMDTKRAIVYFDCGCHKHILEDKCKLHPNHDPSSFVTCLNYIGNLMNCALIGWIKQISPRLDLSPSNIHYKFKESIFINPNEIKCKNCKIILCIFLGHHIRKYFSRYDDNDNFKTLLQGKRSIFAKIMLIYMTSRLLKYCFSSWHTTKYFITNDTFIPFRTKLAVLNFINFGIGTLLAFHKPMTENDRMDAIIFRITCESLTDLLRVYMKHYNRYKDTEWFRGLAQRNKCEIHDELEHYAQILPKYFKEQRLILIKRKTGDSFKNNIWTHHHVINKCIKRLLIFNQMIQGNDDKILNGKFAKYLKMKGKKDKFLRLKSIECQWKYCTRKNDNNTDKFRKCKGCRLSRYCSKKCQKLDWNKGCHKQICALFDNANIQN